MAGCSRECSTSINCQTTRVLDNRASSIDSCDETTPLISIPRGPSRSAVEVCILIFIFFGGFAIGVYLLIVEGEERPANFPFYLVERAEWGASGEPQGQPLNHRIVNHVLVFHTRSVQCEGYRCAQIMRSLQHDFRGRNFTDVPHNFLVSNDGRTFEAQGWRLQSEFSGLAERNISLAVGLIGNFTQLTPKKHQLEETRALINEAIHRGKLNRNFGIFVVRNATEHPQDAQAMIDAVKSWPNWRHVIEYS
uniref:Putative peptidoglycan recognition protein n=1 Tax=Lutzomyia longipalpis TaxID=7200 RepID=A0A1B0CGU9_LUTLO